MLVWLRDLDRPHLQPFYGDYPALVFYARASDVVTGLVDGRIELEEGRPTGLDEVEIPREVKKRLPRWRERLHGSTAVDLSGLLTRWAVSRRWPDRPAA